RYETARALWNAGESTKAQELFRELHAQTLKQGVLPPIDSDFRQAFRSGGDGAAQWAALMREAGDLVISTGDRSAAIALAWQCRRVGDQPLADELFARALAGVADDDRLIPTLAGVAYLSQTGQHARADNLFQPLLAHEEFGEDPWFWRLGAVLAEKRGMT